MSDPISLLNATLRRRLSRQTVSVFVGLAAGLCAIAGMVLGPGRGSLMSMPPVADPG